MFTRVGECTRKKNRLYYYVFIFWMFLFRRLHIEGKQLLVLKLINLFGNNNFKKLFFFKLNNDVLILF